MDAPKSIGEPIGTVIQVKDRAIFVKLDNPSMQLRNGDGFSFISKDHNSIVGFRGDMCKGSLIQCRTVPPEIHVGARLHRNLDTAFEKEIEKDLPERKIPVDVDVSVSEAYGSFKVMVKGGSQDGRVVTLEADAGNKVADNQQRMADMFESQMGKGTGLYSFKLKRLDVLTPGRMLPLMPSSAINAIRREIAAKLDQIPCNKIPMAGPSAGSGTWSGNTVAKEVTYKSNVSNKAARAVLERLGAGSIEEAFELSHKKGAELMRSKYCIRHELGLCGGGKEPLFLVNNGRRYRLDFDCDACEMTVSRA